VQLSGWLHKKRKLGGLNFILLRDRSGLAQILLKNEDEMEKLRELQVGTVLKIVGTVIKDERAPGGVEIHQPKLEIISGVDSEPLIELDKPIRHGSENLDTLFDNRPITLRNIREQAVFKLQAETLRAFRAFFQKNDFTEINTPKLLAEATEGGAEVFTLDYFGKTATLAQSAQFYKQIMVGVFERVYETNPTFRAEPSATTRHMTEYITIDAEIGFINELEELLEYAGSCLLYIISEIEQDCKKELQVWDASEVILPKKASDIPRITIDEIHRNFAKANKETHEGEDDLAPVEEKWICEYAKKKFGSEAVFVTGWSAKSKTFKFYHRANEKNPDLADRADLLFRGLEIITASMREHRYERLIDQLKSKGGDPKHPGYSALLSTYQFGMPPHGGWGWGLERTVAKLLGLNSVKEASLFPRDINRLSP
jgi:nondiscriminating aspartyl-tRNA synthetase